MKNQEKRMGKNDEAVTVGMHIIEKAIGKKPRKPQTYDMRKRMGTPEDLEFCKNYDERIAEWEAKYDDFRKKQIEENKKYKELEDKIEVKKVPPIIPNHKGVLADFNSFYKIINKVEFNPKNPFSNTDEPLQYIYTLIFYFLKDERFFKSPLLRKDLSEPSFDKGTLSIGGYGCGKTSTWNALLASFKNHVDYIKKQKPSNQDELVKMFHLNKCISSDIVHKYTVCKDKNMIDDLLRPLMSYTPLYIDDILREQDASNFGKLNIFLTVLTHRADRGYKSHLSLNYKEKNVNGLVENASVEESLLQFRERYDGRVHDRLFGMYNIIELTGKSFRR